MGNRQGVKDGKVVDNSGQNVRLVQYKKPEVKAMISDIYQVINKIVVEELRRCKFNHGNC